MITAVTKKSKNVSDPILSTPEDVYKLLKDGTSLDSTFMFSHPKKTGGKGIRLSLGRIWANLVWPDDWELINEPITQRVLNQTVYNMSKKYDPEKMVQYMSQIQREAFKLGTLCPSSYNADMFIPTKQWSKKKEELRNNVDKLNPQEVEEQTKLLTDELLTNIKDSGNPGNDLIESGAVGKKDDWSALLVMKGAVTDIEGNVSKPIINSLNDGYSKTEFYEAASEARKNLYIRSVLSSNPGYLTTKLAMANANVQIDKTTEDCKTKKYFEILVTDNIGKLLYGRNYINQQGNIAQIDYKNIDKLIGKKIKLRSPLYCISKNGICQTCYGKSDTDNIGILSAGAVNCTTISTMMKLRHNASTGSAKPVDFIKMLEQAGLNIKDYSTVLDIQKTIIKAKIPCSMLIDTSDYDDESFIDCGDKYRSIGILDVQYGEAPDNLQDLTLPYTFMVDIPKPADTVEEGDIIHMKYEPGEIIINQSFFDDTFNERTIDRLFAGHMKYITNPEVLVMTLQNNLGEIDLIHLETIVSNMFRDGEDITIPARLTGYKNVKIYGQKKLPFVTSWLNAMAFEDINRAIKSGLLSNSDAVMDPIEKLVAEKYHT